MFGAIQITKNDDPDKYKYSGYCIRFDSEESYTHRDGGYGKNVIIFGADMTNSKHANNRTKNVLVLGGDFIQKIDDTTIYAEKMYSPNFSVGNKKFSLSLHYNGDNSYQSVDGKEVNKFKAKDSAIVPDLLCLGNILQDFHNKYMTATELNGYVYDFSVNFDIIAVSDILNIHKYLMEMNGM